VIADISDTNKTNNILCNNVLENQYVLPEFNLFLQFLGLWEISLLSLGRVLTPLLLYSPGNNQRNQMVW